MKNLENLFFAAAEIAGIKFKVISSENGIRKIIINEAQSILKFLNPTKLHFDDPYMFDVFNQLKEYFNRQRKKFSIPLDLQGTDFQKKVWKELMKIPFGKTVSYKFIAEKLFNEKYVRAVGKAVSTNPISIVIPCHRVINTGGGLGGYTGGISVKEKLLELEGSLSMDIFG
jgi:methylated-DNA-[protein]-cysteine S-methyltransferase